jgi:hypothetical protein
MVGANGVYLQTTCSLSLSTSLQRDLPKPSMERPSVLAVHDAPLATTPRKSPFKNHPSWSIRKPALGAPQPVVKALQQTTSPVDAVDIFRGAEIYSWPAAEKINKLSIPPSSVDESRWSAVSLEDDLV